MRLSVPAWMMAAWLLGASVALAHHSQTMYDESKMVTVTGVVTKFAWINPHTMLMVDVTTDKGKVEHWEIETNAAASLGRAGWKRDQFKPGDKVTVSFNPAKNGSTHGMLRKVVGPDGKTLEMPGNGPQKPR